MLTIMLWECGWYTVQIFSIISCCCKHNTDTTANARGIFRGALAPAPYLEVKKLLY